MKSIKLLLTLALISSSVFAAMPSDGGTTGNGQLVVIPKGGKQPVPFEVARSIDSGVYRNFSKLPGLPDSTERRARFDKHYGVYATEWLNIIKDFSPKLHTDLINAGESTIFRFLDNLILWEHEAYPNEGTDFKKFEKAAFYNGEIIFSIPVMEKIGGLDNVLSKEENQGFVVIHELINSAYKNKFSVAERLTIGEIIANIKIQNITKDEFHKEIIARLKTFEFLSKEEPKYVRGILKDIGRTTIIKLDLFTTIFDKIPMLHAYRSFLNENNKSLLFDFIDVFESTKNPNEAMLKIFDLSSSYSNPVTFKNSEHWATEQLKVLYLFTQIFQSMNLIEKNLNLSEIFNTIVKERSLTIVNGWGSENPLEDLILNNYTTSFAKLYIQKLKELEINGLSPELLYYSSAINKKPNYCNNTSIPSPKNLVEQVIDELDLKKFFMSTERLRARLNELSKPYYEKEELNILTQKVTPYEKLIQPSFECLQWGSGPVNSLTTNNFRLFNTYNNLNNPYFCTFGKSPLHQKELFKKIHRKESIFKNKNVEVLEIVDSPLKERIGKSISINVKDFQKCEFIEYSKRLVE